jgi:MinD-like ATPase involved in chromosome partitioning or flagellar assembly
LDTRSTRTSTQTPRSEVDGTPPSAPTPTTDRPAKAPLADAAGPRANPRPNSAPPIPDSSAPANPPKAGPPAKSPEAWQPQTLIPEPKPVPSKGWRRVVFRVSGGTVNPGLNSAERQRRKLQSSIRRPLTGRAAERIAIVSTKGGVGKTTTTLMLGHTLALERGDRVVALDANPDFGTLGYRVTPDSHRTVRDLLDAIEDVHWYPEVRAYTTQASSRLEVLCGDADPAVSEAFTADDYRTVMNVLAHNYNVALTDCGTGVLHDAMSAVLGTATQLVVVTGPAVDQARHADHLIRWLQKHAAGGLVADAIVVVNASRNDVPVDMEAMVQHFGSLVRSVIEIPYDPVLAAGGIDGLDRLDRATQDAYLRLAAEVAGGFGKFGTPLPRRVSGRSMRNRLQRH